MIKRNMIRRDIILRMISKRLNILSLYSIQVGRIGPMMRETRRTRSRLVVSQEHYCQE